MGCFDSVNFRCPSCREVVEVQSKAADCSMNEFSPDEVPAKIAADIMGERVRCSNCHESWTVVSLTSPKTVVMRLA